MPLGVLVLAIALRSSLILLLVPSAYLLQIARIASRVGAKDLHNWKAAAVLMLIKPAEFIGAVSAWLNLGKRDAIQYKSVR
jgi:hypothetical protein